MEPHERIRYIFHTLQRKLLIIVGHNFYDKGGFKTNFLSFCMYALNTLGLTSCIYTLLWYDTSTGLNSIGYGAINIQVMYNDRSVVSFFLNLSHFSHDFFDWFGFTTLVGCKNFFIISLWGHNHSKHRPDHLCVWNQCKD